ncbi:MAG: hypothetical protein KC609_02915 [Myxococcales bacterium]|nr:hypothetical protein [Myxococcales bacterium]
MDRPTEWTPTTTPPAAKEPSSSLFWTSVAIAALSVLVVVAIIAERNQLSSRLELAQKQRDLLLRYQDRLTARIDTLRLQRSTFGAERKRLLQRLNETRREMATDRRMLGLLTRADLQSGAFVVTPPSRVVAHYLSSRETGQGVVFVANYPSWRRGITLQLLCKVAERYRFLSTCQLQRGQFLCNFDARRLLAAPNELVLVEGPTAKAVTIDRASLAGLRVVARATLAAPPPLAAPRPFRRRPTRFRPPDPKRSPISPRPVRRRPVSPRPVRPRPPKPEK